MTPGERRLSKLMRDGFRATTRGFRHLESSVARLDVHSREDMAERRAWERKTDREIAELKRDVDKTLQHARATSAAVKQLTDALVKARTIAKPLTGTGYSEVLGSPRSPRRGR